MATNRINQIRSLGPEALQERIHRAAERLRLAPLDVEEIRHLIHVLTDGSLVASSLIDLLQVSDLIDAHLSPSTLREISVSDADSESIHRVLAVPDHVRTVGDKCLFDAGVARLTPPSGLDFEEIGRRAYLKASRILATLAADKHLRDFYEKNQFHHMSLADEVNFLCHCAEAFPTHVKVLSDVLTPTDASQARRGARSAEAATRPARRPRPRKAAAVAVASSPVDGPPSAPSVSGPPAAAVPGLASTALARSRELLEDEDAGARRVTDLRLVSKSDEEQAGIRLRELVAAEKTVLFSMLDTELLRTELKKVVIHQEGAIDSLCDELSLYSTGTQDPRKPASYFLVGPTGVGKNHLVESLLGLFERLWGIDVPYLELEGPEFTYPSDINELKGAARGFIRSDEEGIMAKFHARSHDKPFSVILIDEVEKAHAQLRRFFLAIMDRGIMMDNRGRTLHFPNTTIFFTSNIGYSDAQRGTAPIGFGDEESQSRAEEHFVEGSLKKALSPEFINRVHVIHFEHLTRPAVDDIFHLEMAKIRRRYRVAQGLRLEVSDAARKELIARGYSREYGARNLAKLLNRHANIEVSKALKRDEQRHENDVQPVLNLLREMREGKRPHDATKMADAVDSVTRVRVPYARLVIDFRGGEFVYERG